MSYTEPDYIFEPLREQNKKCSSCKKVFVVNYDNDDYFGNVMCNTDHTLIVWYICPKCDSTHNTRVTAKDNAMILHEKEEHSSVNIL